MDDSRSIGHAQPPLREVGRGDEDRAVRVAQGDDRLALRLPIQRHGENSDCEAGRRAEGDFVGASLERREGKAATTSRREPEAVAVGN